MTNNLISNRKLDTLLERFEFIEAKLNTSSALANLKDLGQEYSELKPVVEKINNFKGLLSLVDESTQLLNDPEFRELAQEELVVLEKKLNSAREELVLTLIPKDRSDNKAVILEVRAGTGGDEASLFVVDLIKMYQRFSESLGWKFETIEKSFTEVGGIREIVCNISGKGAFSKLKFESGVHRVQRVPETESSGRVHTSAATVAVLPEADEYDLEIKSTDIRIDTMRASGAGGQHVNTTDSAVRITHLETGIVVTSSEKSQHQNRAKAMQVLRTRLADIERQRQTTERAATRKGQVGTGDRSERIRTYNFPQGRVTDHRINLTLYKLEEILNGKLDDIVDGLIAFNTAERMTELVSE